MSSYYKKMLEDIKRKMAEIELICDTYGYEVTPSLVLRHWEGHDKSTIISNDSAGQLVMCICELSNLDDEPEGDPNNNLRVLFIPDDE